MNRYDTLLLGGGSSESRRIIRTNLGENYNLLEAANTRQTLLLMEQNVSCVAAVLLDITRREAVDLPLLTSAASARLLSQVPVIVITDDDRSGTLDACFDLGAADVIPLTYDPHAMLRRIDTIVQLHLHKQNLEQMVQEQARILRHSNETMVDALSSIIEYRSVESGQHILRIRQFTKTLLEQVALVCPEYGLTADQIAIISGAAALHDVGKIGIPDSVLNKPGPLTAPEWETMKTHALIGCRILESLGDIADRDYLRYAHNICHYHHERWDGRGYPEGLRGEEIPICAQVVGLADAYDALTTKRVYKEAIDRTAAANMIFNGECGAFSPKLLECFRQVLPRFEELSLAYADGLSPKSEDFEVQLPGPAEPRAEEGIHALQGQYQSLLHYINGLLLELWVDRGYFHLRYNPYPEFSILSRASDFQELQQITLEKIVAEEDRDRMAELLETGIDEFLRMGMRRQSFRFSLRGRYGTPEDYDVTLLRPDVNQKENRSVTVFCRKLDTQSAPLPQPRRIQPPAVMAGSAFCCRNDRDLTLIRLSAGVGGIAGYDLEQLRSRFGGRLMELVHPQDREDLTNTIREQLNRGVSVQTEFRVLTREGETAWVMFEGRLIPEEGQEYLYCYMTNISDTHRANELLRQKIARYEIILAQTENALFEWNVVEDTLSFSDTWQTIFGLAPISGNLREQLWDAAAFHPDDMPQLLDSYRRLQNGSAYEMVETRIAAPGGRYLWCRIRASAIREETGALKRIVGVVINIDAEKQAERALQDRAERDALTKLLNKEAGRRQAEAYLNQFPGEISCALLIIDLDNFKTINDRYGHLFGDSVLTRAAREIRKLFRAQDIVARIGGDEFMVLMRGASGPALVENRCQRLLSVFRTVFRETEQRISISCSIGVALAPDHGTTYLELFRRADQALYRAKYNGRDTYAVWTGEEGFSARSGRATAVSNRIDSDDLPDLADEGIVPYAFHRLYGSRNMDATIRELLALVGRKTNVSRVYVFENSPDNRFCTNTYEWCGEGITPEIGNLQNVSYETDIPDYLENFNEDGIFCCPDIRELPKNLYDILEPQGIRSILQCAIRENGIFRGYMGFDDCRECRVWTREQVDLLREFSHVLSVFLLKMRCQQRLGEL